MILSAIRIMLYLFFAAILLSQSLTLVTGLCAAGCIAFAIALGVLEYYNQVSITQSKTRREGMWCRMCGGACDLENCGMEQP